MMPLASRAATLMIPSHENRRAAPIAKLRQAASSAWRARANSRANAGRPPNQAPAASRCTMSDARWMSPAVPGVAPAWPIRAMRAIRLAPAANCSRRVRRPRHKRGQQDCKPQPRAPHQSKAGIGEHRPHAAMKAHFDYRRAIDVGGEPHQPGQAGQDRKRERDPHHPGQAAVQRPIVDRRASCARSGFRHQHHETDSAGG